MKIIIKKPNAEATEVALDETNGEAFAFTISHHADVAVIAEQAERRLEAACIPLGKRGGLTVSHTPSGPGAKSYEFGAQSTKIDLVSGKNGFWSLVGVPRIAVHPRPDERLLVTIDADQASSVRQNALSCLHVAEKVSA